MPSESIESFFAQSGPLPTSFDESRRHARFHYPTCADATIYPLPAFPDQSTVACVMLTSNLSRGGIGLLSHLQLYPGQRIDVVLDGQPLRKCIVVWCKRLADKQYAVGCQFATE